jgi:formate dehydrogenase subunit gamma
MATDQIQRFSNQERFWHITGAVTFIVLAVSGLGLYAREFAWLTVLTGGPYLSKWVHFLAGLVFALCQLMNFVEWRRDCSEWTEADGDWLRKSGGYLWSSHADVPEQGRFNTGQKLMFWSTSLESLGLFATGIVLWLPFAFPKGIASLSLVLHAFFGVTLIMLIIIHVYLATAANPGTFRAMWTGRVSAGWARYHHARWWKEVSRP